MDLSKDQLFLTLQKNPGLCEDLFFRLVTPELIIKWFQTNLANGNNNNNSNITHDEALAALKTILETHNSPSNDLDTLTPISPHSPRNPSCVSTLSRNANPTSPISPDKDQLQKPSSRYVFFTHQPTPPSTPLAVTHREAGQPCFSAPPCSATLTLSNRSDSVPIASFCGGSPNLPRRGVNLARRLYGRSRSSSLIRYSNALGNDLIVNTGADDTKQGLCPNSRQTILERRRSSLQAMRMSQSMPANAQTLLSLLIRSKVILPRYATKSHDVIKALRYYDEESFFLEIIRGAVQDLNSISLANTCLAYLGILVGAEHGLLLVPRQWAASSGDMRETTHVWNSMDKGEALIISPDNRSKLNNLLKKSMATGTKIEYDNESMPVEFRDNGIHTLICLPLSLDGEEEEKTCHTDSMGNQGAVLLINFEEVHQRLNEYITFCTISMSNARLLETYSQEYARNKSLLEAVHNLFEEQICLETFVENSLSQIHTLFRCRCAAFMLLETASTNKNATSSSVTFQSIFESDESRRVKKLTKSENSCSKIAKMVCMSGETFKVCGSRSFEEESGAGIHNLLCKPIRDGEYRVIGVAQIINKINGAFQETDEELFEALIIFCGIGINNCKLYEEIALGKARTEVVIEALSYHTSANDAEIDALLATSSPRLSDPGIEEHIFNDFSLNADEMTLASLRIFKNSNLLEKFNINEQTLCRWLLTVRKNYRQVAYHNWSHAFNVLQSMHVCLNKFLLRRFFPDLSRLAMLVGCLCHDLDHRGTNNTFQIRTSSALSQLYGTQATLEQHHFNHAVMILNSHGNNIFANLTSTEYGRIIELLRVAILATDLSLHFQIRDSFFSKVSQDLCDWTQDDNQGLLSNILMTSCDLAAVTKRWPISFKAANLVMSEFYQQGDLERNLYHWQPQEMMDRQKRDELPKLQIGWIDNVCAPLYKHLALLDPVFNAPYKEVLQNREEWCRLEADPTLVDKVDTKIVDQRSISNLCIDFGDRIKEFVNARSSKK